MARRPIPHAQSHAAALSPPVAVIDDDESVRESLPDLLRELGFAVRAYASAREFLDSGEVDATAVLVVDLVMPEMSGAELQRELKNTGRAMPIIFMTAYVSEIVRAQLLEDGAIECLFKPFSAQRLRAALYAALDAT